MKQPRKADLLGQTFNRLTVIGSAESDVRGDAWWLCLCACGKTVVARAKNLKQETVKSCGCLNKERTEATPRGLSGFKRLIRSYREGANSRGLEWHLTDEEFVKLTKSRCWYCGGAPEKKRRGNMKSARSEYVYNGVDRIDNKQGYSAANCVPACFYCNRAKREDSYEDFVAYLDRVAAFRNKS